MYRTDFWTLWEKAKVGCSERIALKQVYYQGWNRSPAQVGCMRQVLGPGALGRPRGIRWRGRWERGSGWGTHVDPWLIHVNVWQKPLQYCKVIILQLIKIKRKETLMLKNWCFWTVVLEKTLESPLDCKDIQPVHPKGNQAWIFIGRPDAETEAPILWPPYSKDWLIGKDPDAGKDWRQEEKVMTQDEMVGCHHQLDGHEFE